MYGADPAVYPHSMSSESIYPTVRTDVKVPQTTRLSTGYPHFDICAHFRRHIWFPGAHRFMQILQPTRANWLLLCVAPISRGCRGSRFASSWLRSIRCSTFVRERFHALAFVTHDSAADPAVYPHNLDNIYPARGSVVRISSSVYPTPAICEPSPSPSRLQD